MDDCRSWPCIPRSRDIRRTNTIHLALISYKRTNIVARRIPARSRLGVKLPFHVTWSGGKLGFGQPSISAARPGGSESGGWAKWTEGNPLHLPLSNPSSSQPSSNPSSPPSSPRRSLSSSINLPNALGMRYSQSTSADSNPRPQPIPINNDSASYLESTQLDAETEQPANFYHCAVYVAIRCRLPCVDTRCRDSFGSDGRSFTKPLGNML